MFNSVVDKVVGNLVVFGWLGFGFVDKVGDGKRQNTCSRFTQK